MFLFNFWNSLKSLGDGQLYINIWSHLYCKFIWFISFLSRIFIEHMRYIEIYYILLENISCYQLLPVMIGSDRQSFLDSNILPIFINLNKNNQKRVTEDNWKAFANHLDLSSLVHSLFCQEVTRFSFKID